MMNPIDEKDHIHTDQFTLNRLVAEQLKRLSDMDLRILEQGTKELAVIERRFRDIDDRLDRIRLWPSNLFMFGSALVGTIIGRLIVGWLA